MDKRLSARAATCIYLACVAGMAGLLYAMSRPVINADWLSVSLPRVAVAAVVAAVLITPWPRHWRRAVIVLTVLVAICSVWMVASVNYRITYNPPWAEYPRWTHAPGPAAEDLATWQAHLDSIGSEREVSE